jgi:hypothetical protein
LWVRSRRRCFNWELVWMLVFWAIGWTQFCYKLKNAIQYSFQSYFRILKYENLNLA